MKNYELVCILDPQVGEAQFEEIITRYEARLKEGGSEEEGVNELHERNWAPSILVW